MTEEVVMPEKEERGLPWDPLWQYVLGDEATDSFYTGTDTDDTGPSFDSTCDSLDDDDERLIEFDTVHDDEEDDDDDDDTKYRDKETGGAAESRFGSNFVSKERYDEAIQALTLYQALAEERLVKNEDLLNEVARVRNSPIPMARSVSFSRTLSNISKKSASANSRSTKKSPYSLTRKSSIGFGSKMFITEPTNMSKKAGSGSFWTRNKAVSGSNSSIVSADRRSEKSKKDHDEDDSDANRSGPESNRWEWELDPDIFPHSSSCRCCGSRRDCNGNRMKESKKLRKKKVTIADTATPTPTATPTTTPAPTATPAPATPATKTKAKTKTTPKPKPKTNITPNLRQQKKKNMLQKLICRTDPLVVAERAVAITSSNSSRVSDTASK